MNNLLALSGSIIFGIILMLILSFLTTQKSSQPLIAPTDSSPPSQSNFSVAIAPSDSLKAKVLSMNAKVLFESRTATEPAQIKDLSQIQQGETVATDNTGDLKAEIPGQLTVSLFPKTELEYIQTLPENIVLSQPQGQVEYTRTGSDPVSIRTNELLVEMDGSDLSINVNTDLSRITVQSLKGSAKVGYNDSNDVSTIQDIFQGDTLIFDENTKTSNVI